MTKLVVVSDFSFKGSGYLNIMSPLCTHLANLGYDIKVIGLGYLGEPHSLPFSIIPCNSISDSRVMLNNLIILGQADIVVVGMDIPYQAQYIDTAKKLGKKVISITPLENPPLTMSWAFILQQADKVFFISQMGADEAQKAGVETAEHLVVGMDTQSWRMRTKEEYEGGRKSLGISEDTLVVLTVADNQERKNLSKAMEIVSKVKKEHGVKVRYILVTRENSEVGWKLRDLAMDYGIASELMIFERGLSFGELYALYAMSDVFLLSSKAEGLGMPVMEAMCIGVPVVATSCGAMPELLGGDFEWERGYLMETEYSMIDPWGNSRRDFPKAASGIQALLNVQLQKSTSPLVAPNRARIYMETRTWDKPTIQVKTAIEELLNEN